jgi:hypothetical protein
MSSVLVPSVPYYRNPTYRPGLAALVEHLMGKDYSSHAIARIFDHVATSGTLEGSLVEAEDMAEAEATFVDNLPELPADSECWDRDTSLIIDLDLLRRNEHPFPIPAVGDDDRDFDAAMAALEDLNVPPVCGGGPEPTEADLQDYGRWSEDIERRRNADEVRAWYRRHPIAEFNAIRDDA